MRKATSDQIKKFDDDFDLGVLREFIVDFETYVSLAKFTEDEKIIFLQTKIGSFHKQNFLVKKEELERKNEIMDWETWKNWMLNRELYRNDDSKAQVELQQFNQYNSKIPFSELYKQMTAVNL